MEDVDLMSEYSEKYNYTETIARIALFAVMWMKNIRKYQLHWKWDLCIWWSGILVASSSWAEEMCTKNFLLHFIPWWIFSQNCHRLSHHFCSRIIRTSHTVCSSFFFVHNLSHLWQVFRHLYIHIYYII